MPRILTLMEAQAAGHIKHIRGHDSNIGMTIEVQNDSAEEITITSEAGTVIGSRDPSKQKMVITRQRSWTVAPRSTENIAVDALCLEAHKAPPSSRAGEADHNISGMTDNADVKKFLNTLQEVETVISANVTAQDTEAQTFSHTLADPSLAALASASSHAKMKGQNKFLSQVYDFLVQMPMWQITDSLGMTDYAKVVGKDKSETLEELRETTEMLTYSAQIAGILLKEAELSHKQTIQPPEGELEILFVEHDLLSSDIGRLRRDALKPGPGREAAQIQLSERTALLGEKEREIRAYQRKDTLIEALSRLSLTTSLAGRTALLSGMRADSLQRDEGIQRLDLDLIITQLTRLGRDENGDILLVKLVDNALPYAQGYETHAELTTLKREFES